MSFWDKLLDWLGIAAKLPEFKQATRIYSDGNKVLKVNSVQHATCGYLVCTYNNSTRENSWIGLLSRGYRIIHTSPNETMGTPALVDGWWVFPAESKRREALVHVNDKTGEVRRGIKALDEYATVCGEGGYIPYANPVRLCDPTGKVVRTWDNFNGIVSGIAKRGKEWVLAIMDGSAPGLAGNDWKVSGAYPETAVLGDKLLGFTKGGDVQLISKGRIEKTIARTGAKAQRARVAGRLAFWTTANPDQLWVTNGRTSKMLHQWPEGDKPDGTSSGSLFNTSLTVVDARTVVVARSVDNRGIELWKVDLK